MLRVYEPLFVVATFFVIIGYIKIVTLSDFFWLYVISKWFWFVPAIAVCYIPIYVVMSRVSSKKGFFALFAALSIAYLLLFLLGVEKTEWVTENWHVQTVATLPLRIIYYFSTMVLGVYMARFHFAVVGRTIDFVWLVAFAASYYIVVALMGRLIPFEMQILDRIPAVGFLVFAFLAVKHPMVEKLFSGSLKQPIVVLAGMSLQIYLVHGYFVNSGVVLGLAFPANLIVFTIATLIAAYVLKQVSLVK